MKKLVDGEEVVFLHEEIWIKMTTQPIPNGFVVYHIDGNTLNNRRENLAMKQGNRDLQLDLVVRE